MYLHLSLSLCLCVCVYIYIYIYIYTFICVCISTYIYVCIVYIYKRRTIEYEAAIDFAVFPALQVTMLHLYMYLSIYVHLSLYVCVCVRESDCELLPSSPPCRCERSFIIGIYAYLCIYVSSIYICACACV